MSEKVTIQSGQSALDIAIQESGTIESLVNLCDANNISVTQILIPGAVLKPISNPQIIEILTYYKNRNLRPATAISNATSQNDSYAATTYVEPNYWQ